MDHHNSPEDGCAPEPGDDNQSNSAVPLLLNPAYARAKSSVFDELSNFRISLKWCALDHSSCTGKAVSYTAFFVLALAVPLATAFSVQAPPSATPVLFNRLAQLQESALAAVSFFTLSAFFRRYGLRQLLLLNGLHNDHACVRCGYARELNRAFRYLACILLPSFLVELAHKIVFFSVVSVRFLGVPCSSIAFAATLASWVYRTGVFLLVCVLFRLTCELQILRFEGFYKMFEEDGSDAEAIFREHLRIKGQLKVTSHRYRNFVIGCLVSISVSQLGALLLVLTSKSDKSFCNSGDLVVCSAVQLSGFLMCLLGAARITHRAQRVVSIASRWHMILSCSSPKDHKTELASPTTTVASDELDGESETDALSPPPWQDVSSTFRRHQALVMYFQHNGGGITLYGFALDRGLLHTLFAFELTLVLWILSKVIVLA